MQVIVDFIPLVFALVAYKMYDIYAAALVLMVAMSVIVIVQLAMGKTVSKMYLWSTALAIVAGSLTWFLRDPLFLMWKPTILYAAAGIVFLAMPLLGKPTIVEGMMSSAFAMPKARWRQLNTIWAVFFFFLAALNIGVAYTVEEATWFQFKVWGMTGLFFVFVIAQSVWVSQFLIDPPDSDTQE